MGGMDQGYSVAPYNGYNSMESTSDPTDAAVRKMVTAAKKRGCVTHDQVNAILPSEEFTSDQIENVFVMLSEMRINVVETEEVETGEADDGKDPAPKG